MIDKYPNQKCRRIYRNCMVKVYVNPHRIHVKDRKGKTILNMTNEPKKPEEIPRKNEKE